MTRMVIILLFLFRCKAFTPKTLAIVGASGPTAALCIERALEMGHNVVAFSRDTSQLVYHERLTAMEGDVGNEDDVSLLLDRNLDSVICADSCPTMLESGIPLLVACMKKQNDVVLRLIAVTFLDGDDHHRTQGAANELIESSELPYVIISKHGPFAKDKECPNRRFLSQFCLYCGIESSCVHIGRTVDLERLDHSRYDTFIERMI